MRLVVDLDDVLITRLQRLVTSEDMDRFISGVVSEKLTVLEKKERIKREMRKSYIATGAESGERARDWEVVDLERWPDDEGLQARRPRPRSLGIGVSDCTATARTAGEERPLPRSWR